MSGLKLFLIKAALPSLKRNIRRDWILIEIAFDPEEYHMTMDANIHIQVDVADCLVYLPLQMSSPTMLYIAFPGLTYFITRVYTF